MKKLLTIIAAITLLAACSHKTGPEITAIKPYVGNTCEYFCKSRISESFIDTCGKYQIGYRFDENGN